MNCNKPPLIVFVLFVLLALTILSCTESKVEFSETGMMIIIENSSGDDFSYTIKESEYFFAPYPFNHSSITIKEQEYEVIVLSKKLERGSEIGVLPIAKMTVNNADNTITEVIVAQASNPEMQIMPIEDFYDLSVKQFYFKQMVQYWYSNRHGLDGSLIKKWEPIGLADLQEN